MKKIVKKFTKILLLTVMVLSELMTPISVLADVATKTTPSKGDIGLNETVTYDENGKNSTTVSAGSLTNEGDVEVTKTVSHVKDESGAVIDGRYKIEFNVKGKDVVNTTETTKPVYVAVVFDTSGSMNCVEFYETMLGYYCVNTGTKWVDAVNGAKTFARTLLTKIPEAQIALVTFATTTSSTPARGFANANLDNANFGTPVGATNLHSGLVKANELLNGDNIPSNANKYIVVISDGEPTYYLTDTTNPNSYDGPGDVTSKSVLDATYGIANKIKNNGTEIFAVGYALETDSFNVNGYGSLTAEKILKNVASADTEEDIKNNIKHYINSDPSAITTAFTNIATSISRNPAGTNATLTDNLGSNFKVVGAEDNTFTISEITESGTTVSFEVEVDQSKITEEGWYNTNEGFTLTYTDSNGNTNAKVEYKKEENQPQVWLTPNMYEYTVNYYKDSFENAPFKSDVFEVSNGTTINSVEVSKYLNNTEYNTVGYKFSEVNGLPVTINSNGKVINVLYIVNSGNLVVKHLEKGTSNILAETENYTGIVGTNYSTNYKTDILGYTVDTTSIPSNTNGTYSEEDTEVIYYYVRKNGEIENPTINKVGPEKVEDVNSTFEYKITASGTVKDYVGKVTLKVTDTLPYEIDEENSILDNSCEYENGTVTCTKEYNITSEDYTTLEDGEKVFNINEEIILNLKYKNITSETVTNNAKSEIILDKVTEESEDDSETKVEKGKVTAIYVEEGNEDNKLSNDETSTGLVGNPYATEEKEIFGYTLVELPENKEGTYTKEDTIVKYVYYKNIGTIEVPTTVKEGPRYVTSVDSIFNYTLKAGATIKDYVGKATLKVTDTLPYTVDKTNSTIDERCVYTSEKEITCTVEYDVTKNNFVINETFNLSLVFDEITDKKVINNVKSYVVLEDLNGPESNDSAETLVDEGKITAIYVEEGNEDNKLSNDETSTGLVGNPYNTEEKEIFGYTLVELPENKEGTYTKEDITVKYVYSKNKGNINNPTINKVGPENVEDVNSTFEYKITASGTVKDYVGKVTLKVTDTLPYEIDEENSTLDNSCEYENGTVTCTKEYNITSEDYTTLEDGEKVFNINEEITLNLKYKNITSETVTNNAKSEIILDKVTKESEDDSETKVEKGKVTAIYVEEGNEDNKLSNDETTEGLVGNPYTTEEKEIFGYTLVELPENKEGTYTKEDITVKYVYSKNKGNINNPTINKVGPENVEDVNSTFEYKITASGTVKDYVGKVTLKVTDTLPYEIDKENSTLDNSCKYENGTVTCTKEYNITEEDYTTLEDGEKVFNINEEITLNLKYKNITSETVTNNAKSEIILDKVTKESEDDSETKVEKGKVTAIYVEEGNDDNKLSNDETTTGLVGNPYTTEEKEIFGYTLVELPENKEGTYTKEDTIVKYVYSKNIGTSKEELEKVGTTNIKDINSKFDYTIKYSTTIMDYVGEAKLVIKDSLPYEIDTEKSKYSNNCKYVNGEIVCTYNKDITKEDNTFIIEEEFELYYINVNKKDVLNRVESILTYGESEKINNDEFVSTVKEGTVVVNYVTKENGKYVGLADSITLTGPVGTEYTTEKKEFDKYNFIEVIGEVNGEYIDGEIEVTYVYDITPLPPQTGVETSPFMIMQYIISVFLLFIINRTYKTSKNN